MNTTASLTPIPATPGKCSHRRHAFLELSLVAILYFVSTAFFTWPLLPNLRTRIIASGDYYLTTYIQAWVAHSITTHPTHVLDMNMLYPSKHVLADSENLFGNQIFFAPTYAVSGNALLAANIVTFLSFWLCALAMYFLVRQVTGNALLGCIAGFIYGFSPPRLAQYGHSQLLSMQWIPLAVLFLISFLFHKRVASLIAFSALLLLQILCSLYLGYIAILVCSAFFVSTLLLRRDLITRGAILQLGGSAVVVAIVLFPILQPYRYAQKGAESPASVLSTAIDASATPLSSYLNIGDGAVSRVYKPVLGHVRSPRFNWEKILFSGFLPIVLSVLGILYGLGVALRARKAAQEEQPLSAAAPSLLLGAVLVLFSSYVLSLGPYLWVHGNVTHTRLPFFWLRLWIPGLAMYRVPARFGLATTFGLSILSAFGFCWTLRLLRGFRWFRANTYERVLAGLVILGLGVEFGSAPFALEPAMTESTVAPEYRWLAGQASNLPLVEIPITVRGQDTDPTEEAAYTYASVFHWHPLVNGYTGHIPPESQELLRTAARLPAADAVWELANSGVRLVVVHLDKMAGPQVSRWRNLPGNGALSIAQDFGTSTVYRIRPDQAAASALFGQEDCSAPAEYPTASLTSAQEIPSALANGDFESSTLNPWQTFQNVAARADNSRAHKGNQSLVESGGVGSVYQDASGLIPGATYTFSVWLSSSAGSTATAQLAIYDPSNDQVKFSPPANACGPHWQLLTISGLAGQSGRLRLHLFRNQGSGAIYWDDVHAYRTR